MEDQIDFLRNRFPALLLTLQANQKGQWGVLNAQQMVEHMTEMFKIASGKTILNRVTADENIDKMKSFAISEKPFKPNTENPLMPKTPPEPFHNEMSASIAELTAEINYFIDHFQSDPNLKTGNPFFGPLNFEENMALLVKHAKHHLKQFNLNAD